MKSVSWSFPAMVCGEGIWWNGVTVLKLRCEVDLDSLIEEPIYTQTSPLRINDACREGYSRRRKNATTS